MRESAAGTGEAARRQRPGQLGQCLLQVLHQDAFQAAHVDEVRGEGLAAGCVQTLGEFINRRSQLVRLALDVAWCHGCETAGVGVLLADAPPGPGHQHPVEDVGRFIDRGRDGMRCEGSEPVRDLGVSLEARFAAKAGVDEAGLALKEFLLEASGGVPGFPGEGSGPEPLQFR